MNLREADICVYLPPVTLCITGDYPDKWTDLVEVLNWQTAWRAANPGCKGELHVPDGVSYTQVNGERIKILRMLKDKAQLRRARSFRPKT